MAIHSPLLATISFDRAGGGVAVVARLVRDALRDLYPRLQTATLLEHHKSRANVAERGRFAARVLWPQCTGQTDFVLFSHLDLTKVLDVQPVQWRRPYGVFLHGIEAWGDLDAQRLSVLTHARVRIANSSFTASSVMAKHPGIGTVTACPLSLVRDTDRARGHVTPPAWLGRHAVLVVGRMAAAERYKGHDQLIEAWPAVVGRVADAQLVIVGHGDDAERLKAKALTSPAASSIVFTGFVTDDTLTMLYRHSAVFALPSRGEGFGLVYLEAMRHRLPCVGSVHDAARDVIDDGVTGRLVNQDEAEPLAHALADLLEQPDVRKHMGEAGHARLQTHFQYDHFVSRFRHALSVAG